MEIIKRILALKGEIVEICWFNEKGEKLTERRICPPDETWKVKIKEKENDTIR